MTAPEPRVQVTEYAVTCIPEGHRESRHFTLRVQWRGNDQWAVTDGLEVLSRTGKWRVEPQPSSRTDSWRKRHRFTLDEALERAKTEAPKMNINGLTVADFLARDEARRA